ncbi:NAD(P)-dependent dehydrogenase (short-subunit alcohol dehydrogenase family) [Arthrobacter globiformis]|uniref:SDR family NAD(P)-dependent oxidoreductase n=1 Tax=Arthrobacter globiformis TaxID=1665 RepID=UPI00278556F0|nr:SDR family NAD(P)-dependent oxidoreductase [Arthrobacter globiformis]MDQ1058467.1 NAD(P)-dependent dehydrogenase (short-subunit alcohol dehydrogenase family) [Arthrobacter globiformis]
MGYMAAMWAPRRARQLGREHDLRHRPHSHTWEDERVLPLPLDVTDPASIQAAVDAAGDVTVLINNDGASVASPGILTHTDAEIRTNVETNFLGPLFLARAFAPTLYAKDESIFIDIHSAMSWYAIGGVYSAGRAALWSATNSLRLELAPEGVHVVGVHVVYVDTVMAATPPILRWTRPISYAP